MRLDPLIKFSKEFERFHDPSRQLFKPLYIRVRELKAMSTYVVEYSFHWRLLLADWVGPTKYDAFDLPKSSP